MLLIKQKHVFVFGLFISLTTIYGCASTRYTPITTVDQVQERREKAVENYVKEQLILHKKDTSFYESLAFGRMIMYKPEAFERLDSLYEVKYSLIQSGQERNIAALGIDKQIEEQRIIAMNQQDDVRYELEHIYSMRDGSMQLVNSGYYFMNPNDSILSIYKRYEFSIPRRLYDLYKNYLFEMHFITPRELYISSSEQQFIRLFKLKENDHIGTTEHESFMLHTLRIMELARRINSVDYVQLTQAIALYQLNQKAENIDIETRHPLIALENNEGELIGYEYTIDWKEMRDENPTLIRTIFEFDPYLRITNMNDQKL